MFGILNLNKPAGITSRDAVNHIQRLVRPDKVGHAGTLDPMAVGVLLVLVGPASRLVPYVHQLPKRYLATFEFGKSSPTDDSEGVVVLHDELAEPSESEIRAQCQQMTGEILQRPPVFSAIKVAGKRAYDMARRGEDVQLAARPVVIHEMTVKNYCYPKLEIEIECGSGTYVRSIGRDLAEALGSKAIMTALVRTAIGDFKIEDSVDPQALTLDTLKAAILPAASAVADLPQVTLDDKCLTEIEHGRIISVAPPTSASEIAALDESGRLRAILIPRSGGLGPRRVFKLGG